MGLGFALLTALCGARVGRAEFRGDELEPRGFEYHDEYFISYLSFRPRLSYRWQWRDAAIGYATTVGSLRATEFYLDQRVRLRIPFSDELTGEYRLIQTEDYDARYTRNEVEVVVRAFRPARLAPLSQTLGFTPMPDGLFFGATAELQAAKEFVDVGGVLGYATANSGIRLDVVRPDVLYNEKNDENGEFTEAPTTVRLSARSDLPESMVRVRAWASYDLPLQLSLPQRDGGLVFRYRQFTAGGAVFWEPWQGFRVDLEVQGEASRKTWDYASGAQPNRDLRRSALLGVAQFELDAEPFLGARASRGDLLFGSIFYHWLDEQVGRSDGVEIELRRSEAYAELGYLLALPTPLPGWEGGARAATQIGMLSERDVRPDDAKHTVGEKLLAKVGIGLEANSRGGRAGFLVQATIRVDDPSFGGANAQVILRF
ncbi:MAG: hypothetical protein KDD82_26880 [Planctomycetes bacterium]|nr:hypothetical protein [Planctomycetota bacterium]